MSEPGRLVFYYGPMGAGKTTLALQTHFNQGQQGRVGLLMTKRDRSGQSLVTSRIGLVADAVLIDDATDVFALVEAYASSRIDYVVCDEAQFLTVAQVDQLARIVDERGLDVFAYGLLTDFRSQLFDGAARLVEISDEMHRLQAVVLCWCGRTAFMNARIVDGVMVRSGEVVAVGDTADGPMQYRALCRLHHMAGVTGS
ncbi:thymidine kinase [Gordonia sp. 852002-51296_SCH5728562-b]|uniref:thymidine kinase n=1 Tax=Gordonia sp. 852002-51296_SCH5728562-b TaxID=1834101 RepID=UPI0007EB366D|nr:thymidine kinase [Gordonia sp. 852002-51296_SCH5728562-b]OBA30866.1 thymidine kinase [Gordonia sp. 852002-51296_SCH5728562-b]